MSSDIVTLLHLDKVLSSKVIVVKEINKCDSSFVTSCVLNHCIKNNDPVILVSTHNSLHHYHNVGLKMNYNLQRYVENGLIYFFDLGQCCLQNLLVNSNIPTLFDIVREKILLIKQKHEKVNVILDGVSHLFDLSYTLREVNTFCKELIDFLQSNSFVMFHCNEADEIDVTHVLSNLLCHKAHMVLEVESLSSGWSADVSGHLTIKQQSLKYDSEHLYAMDMKPNQYLFKLFDRGVKLFAPGTV